MFGNFKELPPIEVLAAIAQTSGMLKLSQSRPKRAIELHLCNAQLRGLRVNTRRIKEPVEARAMLLEIIACREGSFVFERLAQDRLLSDHTLSIQQIVSYGALRESEIQQYHSYLPDPATVFGLAQPTNGRLEDDLHAFWEQAQFLLTRHSSANEIAVGLHLDLGWVQLALYKLRVAGFVRPVQRIREVQMPSPPARVPEQPTLVSQLLDAALRVTKKGS